MRPPDDVLADLLAGWLPRQRWFAGKDRAIGEIAIGAATELHRGPPTGGALDEPELHHVIAAVRQSEGWDHYQLLLGVRRELPERLHYGEIGNFAAGFADDAGHPASAHVYDAVHDVELTRVLLDNMAAEATVGPLRFHRALGAEVETGLESVPSSAEQSNTSLIFGDVYICKLFRRLSPGLNPDLEVNLALTRAGCPHVPGVCGWIDLDPAAAPALAAGPAADEPGAAEPATLAMMSRFLRSGTDGWHMAITSVRDWFAYAPTVCDAAPSTDEDAAAAGGDFAAEAERLGGATAAVHRDLAAAFGVTEVPARHARQMAAHMHRQLDEAIEAVPALAMYETAIRDAFDALARSDAPLTFQRVHGDYHLGQVMRTDTGWVVLDFEGEPARPPGERRALAHPLRDVAGMLRSFEYAARFLIADQSLPSDTAVRLETRAHTWAARNREAFCRGYAAAGGPDPKAHPVLMRAFEFDKAVYEINYEARNRPSWLPVPLRSLSHLAP
ncbi:aminoglycoside phosphotransferase [Actinomadura rubrobrunea]|uniref:Maltokinase n=1 Tax=Actinomadura rubrobrunea TaxID=115335 RepID=A0A9W6PS62_9ACTN|nr:phosphotransferase [Actinomadura rubrobrunea]GLW62482.1 aminoglycoside phosphotransferase [Actinomadura rubrobrunea]